MALAGLTFMPAVSYAISDWLSVGAGFNAMFGVFQQKTALDNRAPGDGEPESAP